MEMKTRFSKVLSVILCLFLLTATASVAFAADPALPGSGTQEDPYVVADVDGLNALAADPAAFAGKYIVLDADIDSGRKALKIIGSSEEAPFSGIFDGRGHTVTGNKITESGNYCGLFGYAKDATIMNVVLNEIPFVKSARTEYADINYIGAVVGYADHTTVSGVRAVACTIDAGAVAGGIVGKAVNNSVVEDCVNIGTAEDGVTSGIVALHAGANGGGIVGEAEDSEIIRCINMADINGDYQKNVAGIVGCMTGSVVSHCLNSGNVSSENVLESPSGVAGIVGSVSGSGTITCCGNAGSISSGTDCSGVAAVVSGDVTISYCYNASELGCNDYFVDSSFPVAPVAAENCIAVGENDVTADDMKNEATYTDWDFDDLWWSPGAGSCHGYGYPMLNDCNLHKMVETDQKIEPSCTANGKTEYRCEDDQCSFRTSVEEEGTMLGHDYSILVSTTPPSCSYEGEKTYKCSRCGQENPEKEIIPVDPDAHLDEDNDNECDLCHKTIKQEEVKKSFFQKVIDFFKRIFDWIRNLFTRNKN
jgi:DNA-directed RNA polymerase subunit RPC12/RpoP